MNKGFGAFGKIPALGDFIRIGLPVSLTGAWDAWMQNVMTTARANLGERWSDCYLSAPIWRFTLAPGALGEQGMSGVLMPSVDRVGRQYPLTLAAPFGGMNAALVHFANRPTFEALEVLALAVLEEEIDRDRLVAALEGLALIAPQTGEPGIARDRTVICRGISPEQLLAAAHIAEHHGNASLWSAAIGPEERLMFSRGLPSPGLATGLFDLAAPEWKSGILDTAT